MSAARSQREAVAEWHRRVAQGYEAPGEADHWLRSVGAGWTAAERALVEAYLPSTGRVLVVGSGGGRELMALRLRGCAGVGIEVARRLLVGYREGRSSDASAVLLADMAALPFHRQRFGAALLFNQVVGHAGTRADRVATIAEALRVVKPGGHVLMSFYVGTTEDYSLLLGAWSRWARRSGSTGESSGSSGSVQSVRMQAIRRRLRAWLRGKVDRLRGVARRVRYERGRSTRQGDDILIVPSPGPGEPSLRRVPFHLYRLDEFFADVVRAGGEVLLWRSNAELNTTSTAPNFLRRLDHHHFCVVVRAAGSFTDTAR